METVIQQVIADFMEAGLPDIFERDITVPKIKNKAVVITGMRRVGKTYLLFQEIERLLREGVEKSRILYINFEDERLSGLDISMMHLITDIYFRSFPDNRNHRVYFFFDEIQNVSGWEKYVRRIMDKENIHFYLTGSSSKMMSGEMASSMRGRSIEITVYPFSYSEIVRLNKLKLPDNKLIGQKLKSHLEHLFDGYLFTGGFPGLDKENSLEYTHILQSYVDMVIFRDIVERYHVTNISILRYLIRHLFSCHAASFSINKFYNGLKSQGLKCGKNTLHDYLQYLEDAFMLFSIKMHSRSEKQKMVNPRKIYSVDTGLTASYLQKGQSDIGRFLENLVFIELKRRNYLIEYFLTQNGYEIDFMCTSVDGKQTLIQVCYNISDPDTYKREIRAINDAFSDRRINKRISDTCFIITQNYEEILTTGSKKIHIVPAWKWLLNLV